MFNHRSKLSYYKNGKNHSNSNRFLDNWVDINCIFTYIYNQGRNGSRILNTIFFPSPKSYLKIAENPSQFFIEYTTHSKKVIKIIRDGYGKKSNLFGSINGFSITKYQEPETISFELGKRHLISGYKELWELIKQSQVEADKILDELENIIEEFKEIINSKIYNDFTFDSNYELMGNEIKNIYKENTFVEIFNEIKNGNSRHLNIGLDPILQIDREHSIDFYTLSFTHKTLAKDNLNNDYFAMGKKENIEKLEKNINILLSCPELNDKIVEYDNKVATKQLFLLLLLFSQQQGYCINFYQCLACFSVIFKTICFKSPL
jgi:hypothetical protein